MKCKTTIYAVVFFSFCIYGFIVVPQTKNNSILKISNETQDCISCHESVTPGIVSDWRTSLHSKNTFELAEQKPALEKLVSSSNVADNLKNVVVGCYECHSLNAIKHKDNFDHFGYKINVIVTPKDCSTCHSQEYNEYSNSKKANALDNLRKNFLYHTLVNNTIGTKDYKHGKIITLEASSFSKNESCYACHGTEVKVIGTIKVKTDLGDIEEPKLTNWPNQGVGRINPDSSKGSCTSCHPRHSFSIAVARNPNTCEQCHLKPDVPAYNIYIESKHGNIFESKKESWNWDNVPWKLGKNFTAPTCSVCHNSLITSPAGDVIVQRTHDFGSRLWVRIFGAIYSYPQTKDGRTYLIKNKDGLPLATTFTDIPASDFLIDAKFQNQRKETMEHLCSSCHSTDWIKSYFEKMDTTLAEADKMVAVSTKIMLNVWGKKLADKSNPFDELIEQKWVQQWLFYANSLRYSAAMSGPDYAAFENGWWQLTKNLNEMLLIAHQLENGK